MLPNPDHGPTLCLVNFIDRPVSLLVLTDLINPIFFIAFRNMGMISATVPKTAFDKNCGLKFRKNNVGSPFQCYHVLFMLQTRAGQRFLKKHLKLCVGAFYFAHDLASFFLRKDVGHYFSI